MRLGACILPWLDRGADTMDAAEKRRKEMIHAQALIIRMDLPLDMRQETEGSI